LSLIVDAGWIGAIASLVAVIVTVILFFVARRRKSLSYQVMTENPLISIDDEIKGRLQLLLDDEPVQNVHLLLIKFCNDGNTAISTSDYERPITIKVTGDSKVLSAQYLNCQSFERNAEHGHKR
jgi:hypothetical protein